MKNTFIEANIRKLGETTDYAATQQSRHLYESTGQFEKQNNFIQSKEIKRKTWRSSSEYAISLNNLASLYESMGQYKAEPLPHYIIKKI
jgi:hypothetical protein